MDNQNIGAFLKSLRVAKGYTQQEVADKLYLSAKTISKWETGEGIPDVSTLPSLADLYGVTIDEILRGKKASSEGAAVAEETKKDNKNAIRLVSDSIYKKYMVGFWIGIGLEGIFLLTVLLIKLLSGAGIVSCAIGMLGLIIAIIIVTLVGKNAISDEFGEEEDIFLAAQVKARKMIAKESLIFADLSLALFLLSLTVLFNFQDAGAVLIYIFFFVGIGCLYPYFFVRHFFKLYRIFEKLSQRDFFSANKKLSLSLVAFWVIFFVYEALLIGFKVSDGSGSNGLKSQMVFITLFMPNYGYYIFRPISIVLTIGLLVGVGFNIVGKLKDWVIHLGCGLLIVAVAMIAYVDFFLCYQDVGGNQFIPNTSFYVPLLLLILSLAAYFVFFALGRKDNSAKEESLDLDK